MKKIIFGVLIIFSPFANGQLLEKHNREALDLRGEVESIRETRYFVNEKDNDVKISDTYTDIEYFFDTHGAEIKRHIYKDNALLSYRIFKYDKSNHLIEEEICYDEECNKKIVIYTTKTTNWKEK